MLTKIFIVLCVFIVLASYVVVTEADAGRQDDRVAVGIPYMMGTNTNTHGPIFWAISDGASFNTGNKVCEFEGYTCKAVIAYSDGMLASKIGCNVETNVGKIGFVACK